MLQTSGGGGGGGFHVSISGLQDGATWLHGDSGDLAGAQHGADGALGSAGGAAGGGSLVGVLDELQGALSFQGAALVAAIHEAGSRLSQNAAVYRHADGHAAVLMGGLFDGVGGSK